MHSLSIKKIISIWLILFSIPIFSQYIGVIPQPNQVNIKKDSLLLNNSLIVNYNNLNKSSISYFENFLLQNLNLKLNSKSKNKYNIIFQNTHHNLGEGYEIHVNKKNIIINASTQNGYFNGINTLLQLLYFYKANEGFKLPQLTIVDEPKFVWRGFMLDEARHFFGEKKVKQLLDWMAFYKLNKFHWHLTDEQGWRIEIKQYPNLTKIGGIGNFFDPNAPAKFYTQKQIIDIVDYASVRGIEIIPEIDMPGHATAANKAYPQFSGGGTKDHPNFTFHPAKEETFQYLSNILKEVSELFPSNIIHLGGDEVAYGSDVWNNDANITALKKQYNFTTNKDVERYFMRRMADSIYTRNTKLAVWDEMVDADLPRNKTIQYWWRHDKTEQLNISLTNGYPTVICPRIPFYLDFVQDVSHKYGRKWGNDFNPIDKLYNFDFSFAFSTEKYKGQILGVQANLWTERITNENRLDFMVFPRLAALAEVAWTNNSQKNYNNFLQILKKQTVLYDTQNIYYYDIFNNSHLEPKVESNTKKYIDNPK